MDMSNVRSTNEGRIALMFASPCMITDLSAYVTVSLDKHIRLRGRLSLEPPVLPSAISKRAIIEITGTRHANVTHEIHLHLVGEAVVRRGQDDSLEKIFLALLINLGLLRDTVQQNGKHDVSS